MKPAVSAAPAKKLSYKLQRELDQMEATILQAEEEVAALHKQTEDPKVMADRARYTALCSQLGEAQTQVRKLYERWAELEAM